MRAFALGTAYAFNNFFSSFIEKTQNRKSIHIHDGGRK
jgi:hypothetical protein